MELTTLINKSTQWPKEQCISPELYLPSKQDISYEQCVSFKRNLPSQQPISSKQPLPPNHPYPPIIAYSTRKSYGQNPLWLDNLRGGYENDAGNPSLLTRWIEEFQFLDGLNVPHHVG
ncbi:hypothetical protein Tco_1024031 [Tanacetum coccineum]